MTERADIQPNGRGWRRLSYTCRCGWVDWGHALPGGPLRLKRQFELERPEWPGLERVDVRLGGAPAFVVVYGLSGGHAPFKLSLDRHWIVRKGLGPARQRRAALGIFLEASRQFEAAQSGFSLFTSSVFSAEDMVSNLIGFHAAFDSLDEALLRRECGEVSVQDSLRVWDTHVPNGLGALKNPTTTPLRFPCAACGSAPSDTAFPARFTATAPDLPGTSWVALRHRYIDGAIVNARGSIDVTLDGSVRLRAPAR